MFRIFLFLLFVFNGCVVQAQTGSEKPLTIGDNLPDIPLGRILNAENQQLRTSDLKGKLVILDFWNIHCAGCVAAMGKMDSLQKQFGDRIRIIPVTYNTESEVRELFAKVKLKQPDLPMVVNDTVFNRLFPHQGDPLHVWIDQKGMVNFITWEYNATVKNITDMLDGKEIHLSLRSDLLVNMDEPLLSTQNSTLLKVADYYSVFVQLHEYTSGNQLKKFFDPVTGNPVMIKAINQSILSLYNYAFNDELYGFETGVIAPFYINNNRISLETADPRALLFPTDPNEADDWIRKNWFSYELKVPNKSSGKIFTIMREELNRFLPYQGQIEKRKKKCLVLVRTGKDDRLASKDKTARPDMKHGKNNFIMRNLPLTEFIKKLTLSNLDLTLPIVDGTGFGGPVDMELNTNLYLINKPMLLKELARYNLELIEREEEIKMLIIKDKK